MSVRRPILHGLSDRNLSFVFTTFGELMGYIMGHILFGWLGVAILLECPLGGYVRLFRFLFVCLITARGYARPQLVHSY